MTGCSPFALTAEKSGMSFLNTSAANIARADDAERNSGLRSSVYADTVSKTAKLDRPPDLSHRVIRLNALPPNPALPASSPPIGADEEQAGSVFDTCRADAQEWRLNGANSGHAIPNPIP